MTKTYRVVAWSTGNVGVHAIAGIDARPDLELVGLWVSNPDKVGKDAGDLAGLGRDPRGGRHRRRRRPARPQARCRRPHGHGRPPADGGASTTCSGSSGPGSTWCSSGPVFLQYPYGVVDDSMIDAGAWTAAVEGGVSLFVNGVDPGFANDALPLVLTGVSERIDEVRVAEILNYATYNQPMVIFDIMGFGRPIDEVPMILQPGVLTMAWGSVVRQLAAGLDVELDSVEEWYERRAGHRDLRGRLGDHREGDRGRAPLRGAGHAGRAGGHRARARDPAARRPGPGMAPAGRPRLLPGHDHAASRTTPSTSSCSGSDGDHNTAGLKATAMRLVNAIPAVVDGAPGLLTALDLPPVSGRGLVR